MQTSCGGRKCSPFKESGSVPQRTVDKGEDGMLIAVCLRRDHAGFCKPEKAFGIYSKRDGKNCWVFNKRVVGFY